MATRRRYSREFKVEAVRLVVERRVTVTQAARDLGVHANVLRSWVRAYRSDPKQAFPGVGQQAPEAIAERRGRRGHQGASATRAPYAVRARRSTGIWGGPAAGRGAGGRGAPRGGARASDTGRPRAGQVQSYAALPPVPVGTPCQDRAGSSGFVIPMVNGGQGGGQPTATMSSTCQFTNGPMVGQTQSYVGIPGVQPVRVGSPCQDGQGSTGIAAPNGSTSGGP